MSEQQIIKDGTFPKGKHITKAHKISTQISPGQMPHISIRVKNSSTLIRTGVTALLLQVPLNHNTTEVFYATSLQKAWSLNVPQV